MSTGYPEKYKNQLRNFVQANSDSFDTMDSNDREPKINVRNQVAFLANLLNHNSPLLAPPHIEEALSRDIHYFGVCGAPEVCPQPKAQKMAAPVYLKDLEGRDHIPPASEPQSATPAIPTTPPTSSPLIRRNVYLNRQTTISTLYIYEDANVWVEYPETKTDRPIGYLFRRNPQDWQSPAYSFAYSLGQPAGKTKKGDGGCPLLIGVNGKQVPYTIRSVTCQGVKVCPMLDPEIMKAIYVSANISDVESRLRNDQQYHLDAASPARDTFQKTLALICTLQDSGCRAPVQEQTVLSEKERYFREKYAEHKMKTQRGSAGLNMKETCQGRILLHNASGPKPYISCEHYSSGGNRAHLVQPLDESYDLIYLQAYFNEDIRDVNRMEEEAAKMGYGPRATCTTIANATSQLLSCPNDHRTWLDGLEDEQLARPKMIRLACETKFRILEPLEEYRASCPYILITVAGEHPHPIPLPQRTPLPIRSEILRLLDSFGEELLELTPSKFREHPLVDAFLRQRFPDCRCTPSLSDFHVSLANRSHIVTYINEAKKKRLSCRTIGDGLVQSNSLVAEADKSTREETAIQLQNKSGDVVSSVGAWRDLDVKRRLSHHNLPVSGDDKIHGTKKKKLCTGG